MFSFIFGITLVAISLVSNNFIQAAYDSNKPKPKDIIPTVSLKLDHSLQPTSIPTPTVKEIIHTPIIKPTSAVSNRVEVKLFDYQWEYNGPSYFCHSYAIPELKSFEPKVVEVTKQYRECDSTPIDEAIEKGYVCTTECPPEGGECKSVCPESAYKHIEDCQAPAKPTWDQWHAMRNKYCIQAR
jgi:hypothetical protein